MGTYVSNERVVRDGRLVAFAGETMTEEEARERGIFPKPKPKPKRKAKTKDKTEE